MTFPLKRHRGPSSAVAANGGSEACGIGTADP